MIISDKSSTQDHELELMTNDSILYHKQVINACSIPSHMISSYWIMYFEKEAI